MKPGVKTTEFWLSLAAVVVSAIIGSDLIGESSPVGQGLAVVAGALAALGYSASRGLAKRG